MTPRQSLECAIAVLFEQWKQARQTDDYPRANRALAEISHKATLLHQDAFEVVERLHRQSQFTCPICAKKFDSEHALNGHKKGCKQ